MDTHCETPQTAVHANANIIFIITGGTDANIERSILAFVK